MLPIVSVVDISKSYGARNVFEGLSLNIVEGEKIGLIGHNGCGKSTFLKILAGLEYCDDGDVIHHKKIHIAYLPQNPEFSDTDTPRSVVSGALAVQQGRIEEYERLCGRIAEGGSEAEIEKLSREQERLQSEIEQHGGWSLDHNIEGMLERLGFPVEMLDARALTLSGGQRRRIALAKILLERPDLMLLDEPTNHLDTETVEWLEGVLREFRAAVVLVTHDRAFLDSVVTRMVEIHKGELLSFAGNYRNFVEQKARLMDLRRKEQEKYANLLVTELEWLRRGPKARGTKAKARIERVAEIQEKAKEVHENSLTMSFAANSRLGNIIINAEGVSKSYDGRRIFAPFDFTLRRDDCCAVIGPNGCGKTTLLNVLTRRIEPDSGTVIVGKNTHTAYLSQHREELDPQKTVYDALGEGDHVYVNGEAVHKRGFLTRFLFDVPEQDKPVSTLSGGEKCRLLFAKMMCTNANLLVLDEPTNDLDIDSLQTLENALVDYDGAVLFVTHDRYLINRIASAVLAFEPHTGTFIRYEGDYDFYAGCRKREEDERAAKAKAETEKAKNKAQAKQPETKRPKKITYKESMELAHIEEDILEAEAAKEDIEAEIANPDNYKIPGRAKELSDSLDKANERISYLYERWEYLSSL